MNRRNTVTGLLALCFAPTLARSQPLAKIAKVGYLSIRSEAEPRDEYFRQGLRSLGYVEGKNIVIEYRFAAGRMDRLREFAADLARGDVDVIVAAGPLATRAVRDVSSTKPVVMAFDSDPIGSGFAVSLARPGKNITGLSSLASELSGKQLELLKQIVPKISRVAVFGNTQQPGNAQSLKEVEHAAALFGVKVQYLDILSPKDIEPAFEAARKGRADAAMFLVVGTNILDQRAKIVALAAKHRFPAIFADAAYVESGGLMSYGVSMSDLFLRAATYVDKIIKGSSPAILPIEQPTKFELVVNLKSAKALGLVLPQSVLVRTDRVIE